MGDGELADSASPELASIRRHMRATESKVRDILQRILSSSQSKYLQENIITQRSGRYVVPVKSEFKNEIPGLVHDLSGSGSTFFIEPMGVVKANNELRELQAKEEKEIDRILAELSAEAASFREDISLDYDLLIRLDTIFARGKLSVRMGAMEPALSRKHLFFRRARHPLLDPKTAVANDLGLGETYDTLVITGPNTGGKTVTLKTIGLLTLMAQCGLHIPVGDGSTVRVCQRVLADIGDEQSIAQSLSTFSSHMSNIVGMLQETDGDTLILFDELGGGTDPVEGAALAAAIIEHARSLGALVAATTHYAELKVYAMTTPGVENASCEFDVETLAPTYRLLVGIPGKSNAFAISQRLGLPEEIIQAAAARVSAENVRFEDVLTKLDQQRQEMEKEQRQAAQLRQEMEQAAAKAQEYRDALAKEKEKAEAQAKAEARSILEEARRTADEVFHELSDMRKKAKKEQDWQAVNDQRAGLRHRLNAAEDKLGARPQVEQPPPPPPGQEGGYGDHPENRHPGHRPVGEQGGGPPAPGGHPPDHRQAGGGPSGGRGDPDPKAGPAVHPAHRAQAPFPGGQGRGGPAGYDHRRGRAHPGPVHRPSHRQQPHPGHGDPRQGHRRGAQGRPRLPEAVQRGGILPPGPVRRGGRMGSPSWT